MYILYKQTKAPPRLYNTTVAEPCQYKSAICIINYIFTIITEILAGTLFEFKGINVGVKNTHFHNYFFTRKLRYGIGIYKGYPLIR